MKKKSSQIKTQSATSETSAANWKHCFHQRSHRKPLHRITILSTWLTPGEMFIDNFLLTNGGKVSLFYLFCSSYFSQRFHFLLLVPNTELQFFRFSLESEFDKFEWLENSESQSLGSFARWACLVNKCSRWNTKPHSIFRVVRYEPVTSVTAVCFLLLELPPLRQIIWAATFGRRQLWFLLKRS